MPPSAGKRAAFPRLRPSASPHHPPRLRQPANPSSIRRLALRAFHAFVCRRTRRPSTPLLRRQGRRPSQAPSASEPAALLCISSADKHAHLPGSVRQRARCPFRDPYSGKSAHLHAFLRRRSRTASPRQQILCDCLLLHGIRILKVPCEWTEAGRDQNSIDRFQGF
jgi:hypothetical protein